MGLSEYYTLDCHSFQRTPAVNLNSFCMIKKRKNKLEFEQLPTPLTPAALSVKAPDQLRNPLEFYCHLEEKKNTFCVKMNEVDNRDGI